MMNLTFDPHGKVALVTGANRGIGKTISESLLQAGVTRLYAAVRNPESAKPLIEAHGDKVVPLAVDLSKPETIQAAAKEAGDVQLVVNNAGILEVANPLQPEAFDTLAREIQVNVYGLLHVAQAFAPILKNNGGGALVQLNSVASLKSFADFATYAASKAAAYSLTQGLKEKLAEQGTLVVSVHPGPIATDMAQSAGLGDIAEPTSLVADDLIAALREGRFHSFPDTMARQFWQAYEPFAQNVVEPAMTEA